MHVFALTTHNITAPGIPFANCNLDPTCAVVPLFLTGTAATGFY